MRLVWGDGLDQQRRAGKPLIFAIIPHGIAPFGITAYPAYSRLTGGMRPPLTRATIALPVR